MIKWRLSDPEEDLMFIENPDTGELENYIPYAVIHCETKDDFERFQKMLKCDVDKIVEKISERSELIRPVGWTTKTEVVRTKDVLDIVMAGGKGC